VRFSTITAACFVWGMLALVAFICVFAVCFAGQSQADTSTGEKPSGNSKCYVCHPGLKTEELTTVHLDMDVTCDGCHGPSIEHMHDEMLMTEPDLLFGRSEVNKMCSNPLCHKAGSDRQIYGFQDHMDPAAVKAFYEKWQGRTRPNGRAITHDSVCTDCHGTHNLDKPIDTKSEEQPADWITAFNGRDLAGWRSSGSGSWAVKRGQIVGTLTAKGEGGDIWTEDVYEDFLLAVTFRATWPIHAGIWLRSEHGPRIEIIHALKADKLSAFTGSVWIKGKGTVLVNLREDFLDREGWNTISVNVRGDRVQVWLNGEEIGAVRTTGPAKGRIGLHIEKSADSKTGQFSVREVLVQRLS
jgi:hypothetical protein